MAKRSFYVKDSELDDYQVKVINKKTDNSYIVKGCAGSGKSILALWKAKQIQDEHKGTYLYIVFTKALMQYMADGISQVGIPQRNVDYHWHWQNKAGCPSADYIIVDEAQATRRSARRSVRPHWRRSPICWWWATGIWRRVPSPSVPVPARIWVP